MLQPPFPSPSLFEESEIPSPVQWTEWLSNLSIQWGAVLRDGLQFLLLVGIIYFAYDRFARQAQADRLIRGLFILLSIFIALWGVCRLTQLAFLEMVFGASIQLLIIGLIVIFQPELRRLLVALGQAQWFTWHEPVKVARSTHPAHLCIEALRDAVRFMSRTKTGALIVLEPAHGQGSDQASYLEAGVSIGATISSELLLTIFHPNTPLHDGAVVIDPACTIAAAGVLLPLTEEPNLSWRYGTRHRAAIGLTEINPSHCIVVSEETGSISYVANGTLEKMGNADELVSKLNLFYRIEEAKKPAPSPTPLIAVPTSSSSSAAARKGESTNTTAAGVASSAGVVGSHSVAKVGSFIASLEEALPSRLQQLLQSGPPSSSSATGGLGANTSGNSGEGKHAPSSNDSHHHGDELG